MCKDFLNSEGYSDPAAFAAIRNADTFCIEHPNGMVRIYPDVFFPCTVEKSKKLFRLVRSYCNPEAQEQLLSFMLKKSVQLSAEVLRLDRCLSTLRVGSLEYRNTMESLHRVRKAHTRLTRNIQDYTAGRGFK